MSLSPHRERRLLDTSEHLAATDPALARRPMSFRWPSGPRRLLVLEAVLAVTTGGPVPGPKVAS